MKNSSLLISLILVINYQSQAQFTTSQLQDSVLFYSDKTQFAKALPFTEQLVKKFKMEKGEKDSIYLRTVTTWGEMLSNTRHFQDAEKILLQNASDISSALGPQNLLLSRCHQALGGMYSEKQEFKTAESHFLKAIEIRKYAIDTDHEMGVLYNNLGSLYFSTGAYNLAENQYKAAFEIWNKLYGDNHKLIGMAYSNLGTMADLGGRFEEAETLFNKSIEVKTKILGPSHPDLAISYGNLGSFYFTQSRYRKAEDCYLKSLEIRLANFGEKNVGVARMFNNLGMLNAKLGLFEKAESNYLKSIDLRIGLLGENHPQVAESYVALAVAYCDQGKLTKAEPYFLKTIEIQKIKLGENHPVIATTYNNTGNLYYRMHNFAKAEYYYRKSLEIRRKVFGEKNQYVAGCYNNLGTLFNDMGEFAQSEEYYKKGLSTYLAAVGENHQDVAISHFQLARNLIDKQKQEEAFYHLEKGMENLIYQIELNFPILSETEKQSFFQYWMRENLDNLASFSLMNSAKYPNQKALLYNSTLATKAIILNSTQKLRKRLMQTPDTNIRKRFEIWEKNRKEIARIYQGKDSIELATLKKLTGETEKMEKELSRLTHDFTSLADKKVPLWTDIQKKLKTREAAIEIVRIRKYGNTILVTDTSNPLKPQYQLRGLTDSILYAALIIKKGIKYPETVILPNGNELEEKGLRYYRNCIQKKLDDQKSYNRFWAPIGKKLGTKIETIYFSPEGIFHSINLNSLKNPKTNKFLLDELKIKQLTNTKDLLTFQTSNQNLNNVCLAGYPDYNMTSDKILSLVTRGAQTKIEKLPGLTRSELFAELPGTKQEVESISEILTGSGFSVQSLLGENALEESIKALNQPGILHIATHGYFHSDTSKNINPLLFSGLLLSGANKTLSGQQNDQVEDGILTAYEAMNLNLDNTDLVLLSACETGLGEIINGEGVYGLQRAFKIAGAKSIIMSLWKVDDDATQELMVSFYKHWLGPTQPSPEGRVNASKTSLQGNSVVPGRLRSAFLAAQKELKAKYPDPYYWGAFVMVGE
jgi:CHAT domain-containing protein/tetratricopeptide (TPR) repeat protein